MSLLLAIHGLKASNDDESDYNWLSVMEDTEKKEYLLLRELVGEGAEHFVVVLDA